MLDPEEIDDLEWHCRDQWKHGWGEGYAHCPREGVSLGLYIHFWQDAAAPLLTREQMQQAEHQRTAAAKGRTLPLVTEITPDTFWTLLDQATEAVYLSACGCDRSGPGGQHNGDARPGLYERRCQGTFL